MGQERVKILVGYHKPSVLIKNDILVPVHLGRALINQHSKDSVANDFDYQWMLDNLIGDDTGDNISHKNREFCELTGFYWAWKNYNELGSPDYIGFMHYRRFISFDLLAQEEDRLFLETISNNDISAHLSDEKINHVVNENDIVVVKPLHLKKSVLDHYCGVGDKPDHEKEDIDLLFDLIKKDYPLYVDVTKEYFSRKEGFFWNIFVMKKEVFFEYCEFMFSILLKIHDNIKYEHYSEYNLRAVAFLAERITGIFIFNKIQEGQLAIKQMTSVFVKHTNIEEKILPAFKINNNPIFFATDNNYAPYCGVLIQSIIANSSKDKNYDIIVLEETLSQEYKHKLLALTEDKRNFLLRFCNMGLLMKNKKYHICGHFTIATYYRLFAPEIFKNYDKIVYLDIDTAVNKDIGQLCGVELNNNYLAAVSDYGVMAKIKSKRAEPIEYFQKRLGVKDPFKEYFQAGVLVFNIKRMIENNVQEDLLKTAAEHKFNYLDQDVLNKVCYGKVLMLDSAWNTLTDEGSKRGLMHLIPHGYYKKWKDDIVNPKIIHYASFNKPWKNPESHLADIWWSYARKTSFYEEILLKNILSQQNFSISMIKEALKEKQLKRKYCMYKILSKITFGKMRKYYKQKRKNSKNRLLSIKQFLK